MNIMTLSLINIYRIRYVHVLIRSRPCHLPLKRDSAKKWLMEDPEAFNWSPYFSYVVEKLENKSKEEAEEREEQARRLVKAVVHCDIRETPPIESDYSKKNTIL